MLGVGNQPTAGLRLSLDDVGLSNGGGSQNPWRCTVLLLCRSLTHSSLCGLDLLLGILLALKGGNRLRLECAWECIGLGKGHFRQHPGGL